MATNLMAQTSKEEQISQKKTSQLADFTKNKGERIKGSGLNS
jgi:hypothetical protein